MSGDGQGVFAGSDSVGRYWQSRCLGFDVLDGNGERVGTVAGLELDPGAVAAREILVRRRGLVRSRLLRVRPYAVVLVDPWQRSLVVSMPRGRPFPGPRAVGAARGSAVAAGTGLVRAAAAGVAAARPGGKRARSAGSALARQGLTLGRHGRSVAMQWARIAGPRVAALVGLTLWLYGVVVFRLVEAAWQLLRAAGSTVLRIGVSALRRFRPTVAPSLARLGSIGSARLRRLAERVPAHPVRRPR